MILVGAVLTQLGLIVATPALVGGAARLGRFLPNHAAAGAAGRRAAPWAQRRPTGGGGPSDRPAH